jgi:cation diffusion facilitator CzcD-associated flavoprotein CzcO
MHPMISDYYARIYSDSSKTPDPVPSVEPESFADMDPAEVPESAIYANLHTNLPRDVMCLRNRPFKESVPVYPPHATVLEYVQDFEKDEKLTDYVRYNTSVMDAEYKHNNWLVTSYDINTQQKLTESYDALIVANGHYFKPYIPDIAGLSRFKDIERQKANGVRIMHSRHYRVPEEFDNLVSFLFINCQINYNINNCFQNVLVIGNAASARDVTREGQTKAKKVYQSIRKSSVPPLEEGDNSGIIVVPAITEFLHNGDKGTIKCEDGTEITDVDVVVFATGYLFNLPFLSRDLGSQLITDGQIVHNLYQHLFYINNPTLAFIGIPIRVVPFPLSQVQSKVVARCWSGRARLPSKKDMEKWYKLQPEHIRPRDGFVFGSQREIKYIEQLGMWAEGFRPNDNVDDWDSNDPVTGRLSSSWKDRRTRALEIRKQYLGY